MALSGVLGEVSLRADSIDTTATVTLEKLDAGWTLSKIHLDVTAKVPGATDAAFQDAAGKAKAGCPVSRVLRSEISMTARLA
jgi:osmotically inducible protein OsmC